MQALQDSTCAEHVAAQMPSAADSPKRLGFEGISDAAPHDQDLPWPSQERMKQRSVQLFWSRVSRCYHSRVHAEAVSQYEGDQRSMASAALVLREADDPAK